MSVAEIDRTKLERTELELGLTYVTVSLYLPHTFLHLPCRICFYCKCQKLKDPCPTNAEESQLGHLNFVINNDAIRPTQSFGFGRGRRL